MVVMKVQGLLFVLYWFFFCGSGSKDSKRRKIKFIEPCFAEEQFLHLCTDPTESCHEERADEIKLLRLDGVKVLTLIKCCLEVFNIYVIKFP